MKNLGSVRKYIDIEFIDTEEWLHLHQTEFTNRLMRDLGLHESKRCYIPMQENLKLTTETDSPEVDATMYMNIIGKLNFLTNTNMTFNSMWIKLQDSCKHHKNNTSR